MSKVNWEAKSAAEYINNYKVGLIGLGSPDDVL